MPEPPLLLVFSYHRWHYVCQRPQQLMSRLAGRWHIVFVEEPLPTAGLTCLETRDVAPHLQVLTPRTPLTPPGFHDDQLPLLFPLLAQHLQLRRQPVEVAWLFTPMALPLALALAELNGGLGPPCVVYDCMTDLSGAPGASRLFSQRESALLKAAALVLAGGPSLYQALHERNSHVHCLPNAVDVAHYAPESVSADSDPARQAALLQGALPRPRLGCFGTIDERLDLELVASLADSHPEWTVVMVGPVVRVDPAVLPRRANLHWLGKQPYALLPALLHGWDLCLMPFALNAFTQRISPTQTLEYMAGEKPVVSTAVPDVIALFGEAVAVASTPQAFIGTCERLLAESGAARCRRAMEMLTTVSMHSWDRTADAVHSLLLNALSRQSARALTGPQGKGSKAEDTGLPARVAMHADHGAGL